MIKKINLEKFRVAVLYINHSNEKPRNLYISERVNTFVLSNNLNFTSLMKIYFKSLIAFFKFKGLYSNLLLQKLSITNIDSHITLGSGFGQCLQTTLPYFQKHWSKLGSIHFSEIPGIKPATVMDHQGSFHYIKHEQTGAITQIQQGRIHGYEGYEPREVIKPVMLASFLGTKKFILTNAAGGINSTYKAGDAMIIKDHVNFTGKNPLIGTNPLHPKTREILGPRFPDISGAYNKSINTLLKNNLLKNLISTHEGIYLGLLGPSFETPGEISLFQKWGMDAVGMSTIWETIALTHAGARVNALSLISNMACGIGNDSLDHLAILETCGKSSELIFIALLETLEQELLG
jgi:purine-nucleoside phosphorylase